MSPSLWCCRYSAASRQSFSLLYLGYALAALLPSIAIAIRRLHDTGKSGWMILVGLIPLVGPIILIVFYVQASDGPNEYGTGSED